MPVKILKVLKRLTILSYLISFVFFKSKNDSVNIQLNNRSVNNTEKSFILTWEKISVDLPQKKQTLLDKIKKVPIKTNKPIICNGKFTL